MRRKNTDYMVLNDATALGASTAAVTILGRDGSVVELGTRSKGRIASRLVRLPPLP